jgi:hypothetical protein
MIPENLPFYLKPPHITQEYFAQQESTYEKLLAAGMLTLGNRPNLNSHLHAMSWPVAITAMGSNRIMYPDEDDVIPGLTIETAPFTEVVAPADARIVRVDRENREDDGLATVLLFADDPKITIALGNLVTASLPSKFDGIDQFDRFSQVAVNAEEHLGSVGKLYLGLPPKHFPTVRLNNLPVLMSYQPWGPTEQFPRSSLVSPLPFLQRLYPNS